jgi:hypothetical protein
LESSEATGETVFRQQGTIGNIIDRALEFDFTQPLAFAALAIVYIVSRIPWLNLGYGTDPDAWRVALTAEHLLSKGEYYPSRLPGFPLHEFVTVPLVRGGWVWTNLSTVIVSLVGVYLFARILTNLKLPNKGVLTIAFAFAPLLWINSVSTMDYMWALTFILASYLALIQRRFLLGGVCLGLAVGFRLTSCWAAPAFLILLWRERQLRSAIPFFGALGATSLIAYSPVLAVYGLRMFNFYDAKVGFLSVLKLLGKDTLGIVGTLSVIIGLTLSLPKLLKLPRDLPRESHLAMWVAMVILFFASFTRLPHEVAYLIPVFPFGFFLMARYFQRTVLVGVSAMILFAGFVDVTTPGDEINRESFTSAEIGSGMMLSDIDTLKNQRNFADELASISLPPHSVVFTGFIYPQFVMRNKDRLDIGILDHDYQAISMLSDRGVAVDEENDIRYVWLLKYNAFQAFSDEGYQFFYVRDAEKSNASVFGYRPAYFGATKLALKSDTASGEGTAKTDR